EDLVRVLIEEQVVIAKVRTAHVPVEVLGLEVEREDIGEDGIERAGDFADAFVIKVGRGIERGFAAAHEVIGILGSGRLHDSGPRCIEDEWGGMARPSRLYINHASVAPADTNGAMPVTVARTGDPPANHRLTFHVVTDIPRLCQ